MTQHLWVGRDLRHKANSRWWALSGYVAARRITSERALCLGVLLRSVSGALAFAGTPTKTVDACYFSVRKYPPLTAWLLTLGLLAV